MPDRDDDLDTEIDKRPLEVSLDADGASVSKLRTAIDHDLAKRLLQAFPEKFEEPDSPASSKDKPATIPGVGPASARRLPRTVLQAPLSIRASEAQHAQDSFDAPVNATDIPLARFGQVLRRFRNSVGSIPASVRTLLGALLLAGAVGLGWWVSSTPVSVSKTVPRMPAPANTSLSVSQGAIKSHRHATQNNNASIPTASGDQALADGSSVAETEAARAFIKGQRVEAINLYQRLLRHYPERKVYAVAIEVLQRSLQQTCDNGVTMKGEPCAEN